jgi:peptidoglycan DL-endopeptidase CwlO
VQEVYTLAQLGTPDSDENPLRPPEASHNAPAPIEYASRRSLRNQPPAKKQTVARVVKTPATVAIAAPKTPAAAPKKRGKAGVINIAVMTLAAGLIATMAIPAYAFNPKTAADSQFSSASADSLRAAAQSVAVAPNVAEAAVTREAVTATSVTQLNEENARKQAAVALTAYAKDYTGPSVSDFLANPPYPTFSLAKVFSVAEQYIGTPYVFGGSTPAGFDCSGYVMFVYAQFGIALPHSVSGEAARGTRISIQDAVPGDLIVMPGHIGFYAGNGNIMDAPKAGGFVSIRPIWTSDYYVVRMGI